MESHWVRGKAQVTERVFEELQDTFHLEERGTIDVKGKGQMPTFLLIGRRSTQESFESLA